MSHPAADCRLCGRSGQLVYEGLTDVEFGVPGRWNLRRCSSCILWWRDPQPDAAEIPGLYARYHTHAAETGTPSTFTRMQDRLADLIVPWTLGYGGGRRPLGALLACLPPLRDLAGATLLWLPGSPGARLLDVGAGSGGLLLRLKRRGWSVSGVEPDPEAARGARERLGLPVVQGSLDDLRSSPDRYDVLTFSHVIEHVPDAVELLKSARTLLRPGGRIVVLTPNAEGLGRRWLGRRWRGLEAPRHLSLFSRASLAQTARRAGFRILALRSSARSAMWMWCASRDGFSPAGLLRGALFHAAEEALSWIWRDAGEEILLVAASGT